MRVVINDMVEKLQVLGPLQMKKELPLRALSPEQHALQEVAV